MNDFDMMILDALGIPAKGIVGLTIECRVGSAATVTVNRILPSSDVLLVREVVEKFKVVPADA